MRCALVCDTYYPEKNSAANLLYDLVDFSTKNLDIIYDIYTVGDHVSRSEDANVSIFRYQKDLKKKSYYVRAVLEIVSGLYFCYLYFRFRRKTKYDTVIFYNPSILQLFFIFFLKVKCPNAVFALILRDIFPDWAIELGLIRNKFLQKLLYIAKGWNIRLADLVYCESLNKLAHVKKRFPNTNAHILYNWSNFSIPKKTQHKRSKKRFVYAGNVGEAQDILSCMPFFNDLTAGGHTVDFYSEGKELDKLKVKLAMNTRVNFVQPVPTPQLNLILPQYDGGLVFLAQSLNFDNIPGKILSYLKHGLPIFGAVNLGNEIVTIVKSNSLGALVDDRRLLSSTEYRTEMLTLCDSLDRQKVCKQASNMFSVETAVKRLIKDVEQLRTYKAKINDIANPEHRK